MKTKLVRGTRDFGPKEVLQRRYIFDTLRRYFEAFGFRPLETPAMEELDTLMGKYGEEGDRLLYKILNNGDFMSKVSDEAWSARESKGLLRQLASNGLRYDLTVPFARYVALNRHQLSLPFKRYQIQPVWRGDNPQHGRYREFYQCDVDVAGSRSLLYEAELLQIYDLAFAELGIQVQIRLNNRKILEGLAELCGQKEAFIPITVAIDKLDKIGWDGVQKELQNLGLNDQALERVADFLRIETLADLQTFMQPSEIGLKGVEELREVLSYWADYQPKNQLILDVSLARGLGYYTGCIVEVVVDKSAPGQEEVKMGSIGGGGRYDDLTGVFGLADCSGVGISFGADRIYDVLQQLGRFEQLALDDTQLLFLPMDAEALKPAFRLATGLRQKGYRVAIYPEAAKFKKQMDYANKMGLPFVAILGSEELAGNYVQLKDMRGGGQEKIHFADLETALAQRFEA